MNLLNMLQDQVTDQIAGQASSFLGESESAVRKGLGGAFPALLGSMIQKGSSESGAEGLMSALGNFDGGLLDNLGGLFGGGQPALDKVMNSGGGILDMLLGNKMGGVIDLISKVGGLKSGSSSTLLKLAGPLLMGMVSRQIRKKGLGIGGLMEMLMGQKDHVKEAMPAGMGNLLGLGSLMGGATQAVSALKDTGAKAATAAGNVTRDAVSAGRNVATDTVNAGKKAGSSILKWLIPAIIVLGLLGWLLKTQACSGTGIGAIDKAAETVASATESVVEGAGDMVKDGAKMVSQGVTAAFNTVDEAAKKALDGITFAAGSVGEKMMAFINGGAKEGDGLFRFENLTFQTGSAAFTEGSGQEVDNLAAILKAYPDVTIEVQGHTDNTGDAAQNKALSQARAEAVKARLVTQGIAPGRISAAGYGQEMPVASNDTEEGRQQNRRVEVKITN